MSISTNRLAGVAYLTIEGISYMVAGDAKYSVGTFKRETLIGQDSVHGFSEMPSAPFISMTVRDSGELSMAAFNLMRDVSVVLELANGKVVSGGDMWTTEVQEVNTTEGTFEVKFEGRSVTEA